jgi:hypothetical protein
VQLHYQYLPVIDLSLSFHSFGSFSNLAGATLQTHLTVSKTAFKVRLYVISGILYQAHQPD